MLDKSLKEDNAILTNRIFEIVTEDRERRTHEFCPGLRVGRGGTVIDCYESSCQPFSEYKQYVRKKMRRNKDEKIDQGNVYIKKYIDASKSTVANKDLRKSYENNRVLYNFLSSGTPHTALHLGILKKAKFELRKSNNSNGYIHRLGSPSKSPTRSTSDVQIPNPKHPSTGEKQQNLNPTAALFEPEPNPVMVIESRLEMEVGRELLSRQQRLQPLFAECARYGGITSLQLPLSRQPTHIMLPRPRTAPVMRTQLLVQQKEDAESDIEEVAVVVEKQETAQVEQPPQHTLRGIRHLQALRKSVSFENNNSNGINNDSHPHLSEGGEEHVPGSQWSALLDSDSLLLAASFQRLTTNTNYAININSHVLSSAKPLQQELGDELSQLYESLFSRRDQLLSAAQQQEQLEQQQVHEQVQEDPSEVLQDASEQKNWDSCCSDRSSSFSGGGGGSLLQQDESQPSTHRSHRTSLHSFVNNNNMSNSGTAAESDPLHMQGEAELLLELLPQPQEEEPEEVDCSVLALTYSQLDPSTQQLLLQPYFPSRDTHPVRTAEDSVAADPGAGELAENSWLSVSRVLASSECSSRLGRAWQLKNSQRSASVCSELSAPIVAAVEVRMKLKVAQRQNMICQCSVQPTIFVPSSDRALEWQRSDLRTLSCGRVTSFLLNLLDVGVCLPGNSKPCSQEASNFTASSIEHSHQSQEVSSGLVNIHSSIVNTSLANDSDRFSLATSAGLLVELVPVLSQDQDGEEEMDRIGQQLYCRALLSLQQLQGLASRPGFSDLHFAVSELLQYPVDVEPPTVFTPSSKGSHNNSNNNNSSSSSRSRTASQHTTHSSHLPAAALSTTTANHPHMALYSSLGSVLDADTELQLFQLLAGAVQLQVDSSGQATMGFSSRSES